jgi:hypothetical protein
MGGTSDLREPCPHVKPLIQHHTRHPAPHKTYGHHAGTNVNLAGAVSAYHGHMTSRQAPKRPGYMNPAPWLSGVLAGGVVAW